MISARRRDRQRGIGGHAKAVGDEPPRPATDERGRLGCRPATATRATVRRLPRNGRRHLPAHEAKGLEDGEVAPAAVDTRDEGVTHGAEPDEGEEHGQESWESVDLLELLDLGRNRRRRDLVLTGHTAPGSILVDTRRPAHEVLGEALVVGLGVVGTEPESARPASVSAAPSASGTASSTLGNTPATHRPESSRAYGHPRPR